MRDARFACHLLFATAFAALACAAPVTAPAPGRSTAWGYLSIVPRDGVETSRGGSYGDRRMRDVRLVDYSRPGFAVVYGDTPSTAPNAASEVRLTIREGGVGTRLEPSHLALGAGSRVEVRNGSETAHVISCPACGLVRPVAAGASESVELGDSGEYTFFLLDVPSATSKVFVAPGAHAVVSESGRFELTDLAPGRQRIHAWHPRLPPSSRWVDLEPDGVSRVDLEVGVGRGETGDSDAK